MRRLLNTFICAVSLVVGSSLLAASAKAEVRVALVIGNSNYEHATPLLNPTNDANLIARILDLAKFEVVARMNADRASMTEAFSYFAGRLRANPDSVGVIYFAGHGIQVGAKNYLVPTDATGQKLEDLIALDGVMKELGGIGNAANIIILDACRNNPFERTRALGNAGVLPISRGLAAVQRGASEFFIAYATGPGELALDGRGANSPYASALAEFMQQPGLSIESMFKQVRLKVLALTSKKQKPWELSSLTREFYFRGRAEAIEASENCREHLGPYRVKDVAANDVLNIRSNAGFQYKITATIPPDGTGITQEQCKGQWCFVRYKCKSGWVLSKFLGKDLTQASVEAFGPESYATSQGLFRITNVDKDDVLNIRAAPDRSAAVRGEIPFNAENIQVGACNGSADLRRRWCVANYLGLEGWVHAGFLVSMEDDESHPH